MAVPETPEQRRATAPNPIRPTRRAILRAGGLGALAALAIPAHAWARGTTGWDKIGEGGGEQDDASYTGPLYGYTVTWDPELWGLTTSAEEGMGYEYDFAGLSTVFLFAIAQVQYVEAPFDDLEEAADGAVEHYIGGFGMTLDDAEVLDQWATDEAAGGLFYWLGYDDIPYTYIEYAPTEDEDVWSVSYIQVRASAWDAEAMTDVLQAIWIDEAPFVRATDVDEIVDAMVADME